MKCKFCGSKLKKSDEICPNCSKFVFEKDNKPTAAADPEAEPISEFTEEKSDDSVRIFNYKNHILKSLLIPLCTGLFLILMLVLNSLRSNKIYFSSTDFYSYVPVILMIALSFFRGISTYIQEKKCIITVTEDKVFGTIPKGVFQTEDFEVRTADILCVEKEGFHGKHADPAIIIVTAENRIEIKSSSSKLLERFKNTLQERIVENEING